VEYLRPYRPSDIDGHPWKDRALDDEGGQRRPGGLSRWSQGKYLAWEPLRPELVVEVAYDHMQKTRFRHTAQFRRWRLDKKPQECTFDQLEIVPPNELTTIFASGR
jgi:ATP-dependent DNA ligase